jgi:hypothetical protein
MVLLFTGFMLFGLMTNLGPNAMTYLIAGEVFPTHIRGKGPGFSGRKLNLFSFIKRMVLSGEENHEFKALFRVQGANTPPVPLDDLPGDGQTQARSPLLNALHPVKGFKESVQFVFRKLSVGVGHAQPQ